MSGILLDTSVVITGIDPADEADQRAAISVITLGELRAGVLLARDPAIRAERQARLAAIHSAFMPLSVDEPVTERYAEILAAARQQGRTTKATDLLIIATAAATGRALWTRDLRQARLAQASEIAVRAEWPGGGA